MQALNPLSSGPSITGAEGLGRLRSRIEELQSDVPKAERSRMLSIIDDGERTPDSVRDAVSTRLMECFRGNMHRACFGLLYELNSQHLLAQVAGRLRRYTSKADPNDVLQEVFFNVYRYPHRFNAERDDAFRVWSAMIVRNTVLKHLRSQSRGGRVEIPFEDLSDQPESMGQTPLSGAIEKESNEECSRVYLAYLQLYLRFYSMLSERERRALHLVEVDGHSYRAAAADLEIKLENLKMVIFRARRKIHRAMRRVFEGLAPDCRPARDPKRAPRGAGENSRASNGTRTATPENRVTRNPVDGADGGVGGER
ncbi:MAG: RNA polymerase sigma factor (sigma-70 family) [Chlamydiales bacterium]|jgi:RNA polymerase sigma factor (sigma-70 family)